MASIEQQKQMSFFEFPEIEEIEKKIRKKHERLKKSKPLVKKPSARALKKEIATTVKATLSRSALKRKKIRKKNRLQKENLRKLMGLKSRLKVFSQASGRKR